jgi:hypothetical protein
MVALLHGVNHVVLALVISHVFLPRVLLMGIHFLGNFVSNPEQNSFSLIANADA